MGKQLPPVPGNGQTWCELGYHAACLNPAGVGCRCHCHQPRQLEEDDDA
jgi:hypothetical protein